MRRLRYSGSILDIDASKLSLLYRLNKGKSLFPNLEYLRLDSWPLTVTEASLIFGPVLQTIDISSTVPFSDVQRVRCLRWGRLSRMQQQQLCIQILKKQSTKLQTLRSAIVIQHTGSHCLVQDITAKLLSSETACLKHFVSSVRCQGRVHLHPDWLMQLARTEDLSSLHLDTSNPRTKIGSPSKVYSLSFLTESIKTFSLSHGSIVLVFPHIYAILGFLCSYFYSLA